MCVETFAVEDGDLWVGGWHQGKADSFHIGCPVWGDFYLGVSRLLVAA